MVLTIALAVSLLAVPVSAAEEQPEEFALSVEGETEPKDDALNEMEPQEQWNSDETDAADTAREETSESEPADAENDIQTFSSNAAEPAEKDDVSAVTVSDYSDGFLQDPDSSDWCYYQDGKIAAGKTGLIKGTVNGTSGYWNVKKGRVVASVDVVKGTVDGTTAWWYVNKNGMVDTSYTGFAANGNGTWYAESGRVSKKANGVYKDSKGAIGAKNNWYYVLNSKVQYDFTGLANYKNASGWWYITKGKVDRSITTVAKNKNGWYYVKNGKVDRSYTGFAKNSSGSWYVRSGKVSKKVNGVYKDASGAIGAKNNWYYVLNSKVQTSFTGLANYKNASGWWYITKGKVDRSVTTVAKNKNGWYYVKNGKVDRSYTGFAKNSSGSWYVKSGKVSKKENGVYKDSSGAIGAKNNWYYVLNSKVQYDFTGIASNENGFWYIQNGKVDRSYTGTYKFGSATYTVTNGKVNLNVNRGNHTLTGDDLSILSGDKGLLSSRSLSQNQYNSLIGQFMANSIVKNTGYSSPNESASWIWNGGTRWDCSATSLYFINYYLLPYANGSATGKKQKILVLRQLIPSVRR